MIDGLGFRYSSPSPDSLNLGVLAAEAVREIAACFHAFVSRADGPGVLKLEPTAELETAPLSVYTFIPLTGKILRRAMIPHTDQTPAGGRKKKAKNSPIKESTSDAKNSAAKDAGKKKAVAKNLKDALDAAANDEDDEEPEEETEDDNDEDDDDAESRELSTLDKMAAAGKKSKPGKQAKSAAKKVKGSIQKAGGSKLPKIGSKIVGKASGDAML